MDATTVEVLLLELILVAILAALSASEAALHTIRRPHVIEDLASRGRRGRRAETMGRKAIEYLAALQVAEFFIVFAFSGIAAAYVAPRLSDLLRFVFGPGAPVVRDVAAVVVTVAVLSLVAVLFGLFVPRSIGARHAQGVLLILVWPLELITWFTRPLVGVLFMLTRILTRPFGGNPQAGALVTEDDIKSLVETGQAQGVLEEREQRMITSIFAISEKPVHEVMVPRTDIVAIDVNTPPAEILKDITKVGHSRIPVYEGSPDNIIGILYVKDLFRRLARGEKDVQIRPYLRPAQFVPESKKIDELLRDMQKDKVHIAIVVDEYGGTSGLVTIEDLVEEIVGEIRDEYDVEQEMVLPISESEALMDARVPFEEVREAFALDLPSSENYDTLGGFIVAQLGRFPRSGETVEAGGARFVVESVEGRRIRRVRVVKKTPTAEMV
ncbi:MAG TPA: hemolysin family protein [Candidatus Limnocylindria bacterium]|nr:hemolysin family protein [Candidatus Limnocylindria bacterium]